VPTRRCNQSGGTTSLKWIKEVNKCGRKHIAGKLLCFKSDPQHIRSDKWYVQTATFDEDGNIVEGECVFDGDKKLYTDGSCFRGSDPEFASAGGAADQIHENGKIARVARIALPRWLPQTAAAGEHVACYLAVCFSLPIGITSQILSDCASVVRSAKSRAYAVNYKRPFAGIWNMIGNKWGWWPVVTKTKAHRTKKEAEKEGDLQDWFGNDLADVYAKKRDRGRHGPKLLSASAGQPSNQRGVVGTGGGKPVTHMAVL